MPLDAQHNPDGNHLKLARQGYAAKTAKCKVLQWRRGTAALATPAFAEITHKRSKTKQAAADQAFVK